MNITRYDALFIYDTFLAHMAQIYGRSLHISEKFSLKFVLYHCRIRICVLAKFWVKKSKVQAHSKYRIL